MIRFAHILGLGAAAAVLATAAHAADAPIYNKDVIVSPAPISVVDWTGMYVGVFGGYGGGDFDYPFQLGTPALATGEIGTTAGGFFGGGQVGFDWQVSPNMVVGAVADIAWSDISDETTIDLTAATVPVTRLTGSAGTDVNYFGTIRARAGYLLTPDALLYVTGGAAYGEVETSISGNLTGAAVGALAASTSETDWGWTVGAGIEYKITENLSFETEYLYVDLGDRNVISDPLFGGSSLDVDTSFHTVRAGINYRFDLF